MPSCKRCNESFNSDDEFFRVCVSSSPSRSESGQQIWYDKVLGSSLKRSPKFKSMLSKNLIKIGVKTPSGIYLGQSPGLTLDARRIDRVILRIIQGLYWHHYQKSLPPKPSPEIWLDPPISPEISNLFLGTQLNSVGGDVFKYRYRLYDDNREVSIWSLLFYMSRHFLIIVNYDAASKRYGA